MPKCRASGAAFVGVLWIAGLAAACGEMAESPMSPAVVRVPESTPASPMVAISGRVTESAPTQILGIGGATLTIADGPNVGESVRTSGSGFYSLAGIRPGTFTVNIAADGFTAATQSVDVTRDSVIDFALHPTERTMTHTSTGDIAATDGTCDDGESAKPCRILVFPVHNAGTIDAHINWTPGEAANLDLALFQTGAATPIARASTAVGVGETVNAQVSGGATYELRITYAGGTSPTTYTVKVMYPY